MSRIVYLAAGSLTWGMGHLKRSIEIIDVLKQQGHDVYSLAYVPADLDRVGLEAVLKPFDRIIHSWNEWGKVDTQLCVIDLPQDLQQPFFDFAKKNLKPPVVAIEWYLPLDNLVIDSVNLREGKDSLRFAIIRREILDQIKVKHPRRYDCMIMLGGRDQKGYAQKIVELFTQDSRLDSFKVAVILGPMDKELSISGKTPGVDVYKNPAHLAQLMASSRVGLCNAGTSLMEMCALGLPTIIFPQTILEEGFAEVFINEGCSVKGSLENNFLVHQLHELWSDDQLWAERSHRASSLIDGQGTQRIIGRINRALGY